MPNQYYSSRNLSFLLFEMHNAASVCNLPYYQEHSIETMKMVLDMADQLAEKELWPYLTEMDRNQPEIQEGQIKVHPAMKRIMELYGEGGWVSSHATFEEGGQQLPFVIGSAASFILGAANYSASVYPFLSSGAANLIRHFGSKELQDRFVPRLFSAKWQGTMALTEPQAGSSLSDIITTAYPQADGSYKIKGQKIYISCGDHDAVENVVHLLLARIKGAPAGVKGISLFVVPQKREIEGKLESNDVQTAGVYHKMGYKGAPIAHLMFGENDDCQGWLVGEEHRGLIYMFQMMNEARIAVGMSAASIASAAYYASLQYANERPQGRKPSNKDLTQAPVNIIEHADIRRLLLFQKSVIEGSLSLLLYCSKLSDLHFAANGEEKENAGLLLDFLTPIAKSYPSEMGCLTTSAAVQILGGAGYLQDFPVEQYYREMRIHPIHEGTTAIHGMDLLGRKVRSKDGKALELLMAEITDCLKKAGGYSELNEFVLQFQMALKDFQEVTRHLFKIAESEGPDEFLADASLYLEFTGTIVIAWQWLAQANVALEALPKTEFDADKKFYNSKLHALEYYFEYELVKIVGLKKKLMSNSRITTRIASDEIV
jgi:alkylation response protein AidB-like acyl-CoA dehydrogenase